VKAALRSSLKKFGKLVLLTAGLVFVRDMFAVMGWSISNLVKITISVGKNRKVNVSLRYWTVSGGYTTRLFAQFRLSS